MMIEHFPLKLCGGLIYSGHTCYFTICAELWRRYSPSKWMVQAIWLVAGVGLYSLISCRYHYTVDIILALAIALMACSTYNTQVLSLDCSCSPHINRSLMCKRLCRAGRTRPCS